MRDIKFRGMDANGVMRYGRLSQDKENSTVYYKDYSQRICWEEGNASCNIPVSNLSLGQYTGLKDNNGKDIYEGDILRYNHMRDGLPPKYSYHTVEWGTTEGTWGSPVWMGFEGNLSHMEIIGNIYENPHLLEGGTS
jgi:uncharacterized phage protein (TIGR01671 family)